MSPLASGAGSASQPCCGVMSRAWPLQRPPRRMSPNAAAVARNLRSATVTVAWTNTGSSAGTVIVGSPLTAPSRARGARGQRSTRSRGVLTRTRTSGGRRRRDGVINRAGSNAEGLQQALHLPLERLRVTTVTPARRLMLVRLLGGGHVRAALRAKLIAVGQLHRVPASRARPRGRAGGGHDDCVGTDVIGLMPPYRPSAIAAQSRHGALQRRVPARDRVGSRDRHPTREARCVPAAQPTSLPPGC